MFSVPIRRYGLEEGGAEAHAVSSSVSQGLSRRTASIRKATYDLSTGSQNYWLDQFSDLYDRHEDFRDVFMRWRRIVRVLRQLCVRLACIRLVSIPVIATVVTRIPGRISDYAISHRCAG